MGTDRLKRTQSVNEGGELLIVGEVMIRVGDPVRFAARRLLHELQRWRSLSVY